jgi:hypothetical protein
MLQMQVYWIVSRVLVCAAIEYVQVLLPTMLQEVCLTSWAAASTVMLPVYRPYCSSLLLAFLPDILNEVEVVPTSSQSQNYREPEGLRSMASEMQEHSYWAGCYLYVPFWILETQLT